MNSYRHNAQRNVLQWRYRYERCPRQTEAAHPSRSPWWQPTPVQPHPTPSATVVEALGIVLGKAKQVNVAARAMTPRCEVFGQVLRGPQGDKG